MAETAPPARAAALSWARSRIAAGEARQLLVAVLQCSPAQLVAWPERELDSAQWAAYQAQVARRAAGEPLAYILGRCEFYGRDFAVTPAVLIPRHDTELLVDLALARLAPATAVRVLDLGCGSGVVAVTLALERPLAQLWAVDQSQPALAVAVDNAARLRAAVKFVHSDWFEALAGERFELIVGNPPYIAAQDPHLEAGDLPFEPLSALAAGERGLDDLQHIIAQAPQHLQPGGWLLLEHGYDQGAAVRALLARAGFADIASWQDLGGQERVSGGCLV